MSKGCQTCIEFERKLRDALDMQLYEKILFYYEAHRVDDMVTEEEAMKEA